ncbi:MAG TPA: SMC family ATPase [Candidatus Scybalocola faecavium]|nr:SMC family ATPase [Candidatus Scybalocola faecavium]
MRPIRLSMQAFGSYGKQTVIDFEAADQNLFLITGDTGAGKSTIFDAIVFALYGEASSGANKKDGTELQSQFAGYDVQPFVELTFLEGTGEARQEYTVRRVPRHFRPLKRGKGTREESETVSLIMPDGTEYPQKETDKKLEEIVGLTKSQFMQVAMIAQGEFMELLRAKSDDKKVIFRKLFHTELYQKIVEELGRRRKETIQEIGQIRTACQTETAHLSIPDPPERAGELEEIWDQLYILKNRILVSENLSIVDMEQLLELLGQLCSRLEEKDVQLFNQYDRANKDYLACRDRYNHSTQLLERFKELEQAEKTLAECDALAEQMDEISVMIRRIKAAWEIHGVYERYKDADKTVQDIQAQLLSQKAALPQLIRDHETALKTAETENLRFNDELQSFTKISQQTQKALEVFSRLKEAKALEKKREKETNQAVEALETAQKKSRELEEKERAWRDKSQKLKDAGVVYARWQGKARKYRELMTDLGAYEKLENEASRQKTEAGQALEQYTLASQSYEKKNESYESARRTFLNMQAGLIAREQLRPGRPCPVCGSLEHPAPCQILEEHKELTRDALEAMEKEVSRLRSAQEKAAAHAQSASGILREKEENLKGEADRFLSQLQENIPDLPELSQKLSVRWAKDQLLHWRQSLAEEGEILKKNVTALSQLEEGLKALEKEKEDVNHQVLQAQSRAAEAREKLAAAQAAREGLETSREFTSEEEALAAKNAARKKRDEAKTRLDHARNAEQMARSSMENAKTLIQKYEEELPLKEQDLKTRRAAYETVMEEKGLTEPDWQEMIQKYPKDSAQSMEKQLNNFNEKKTWAQSRYAQAKEAIGRQSRPDLNALKNKVDLEELLLEEKRKAYDEIHVRLQTNEGVYQALAPKMEERRKVMARNRCLDGLYSLLGGKVSGSRMDLETFVQRYYLERILHSANRRFQEMSAGQFELRMRDMDMAGVGKNRGLDLMVYSAVTGKEREVRTLSGGESFMAALSLALGMADQIQESAASVNLDVMFIDEGFGSLDEHSRDKAVRVLQEMAGGSKMIGIISHVTELKQEIEDQLIVEKDDQGSHVRWQIS